MNDACSSYLYERHMFFIFVWTTHVLYICMNDACSSYLYERRMFFIFVWKKHVLHICINDACSLYLYKENMFFIFVWTTHVLHICMKRHVLHICMNDACSSYLYEWRMSLTIFKTYWAFSCFYNSKLRKLLKQIKKIKLWLNQKITAFYEDFEMIKNMSSTNKRRLIVMNSKRKVIWIKENEIY
jgi:hypothetical protein